MFTTITSKYVGTCKRCNGTIEVGTRIRFGGRGRTYHLAAECPARSDDATARPQADASRVSDTYEISGREYYRNKRGRCEDAPCCGCCTI